MTETHLTRTGCRMKNYTGCKYPCTSFTFFISTLIIFLKNISFTFFSDAFITWLMYTCIQHSWHMLQSATSSINICVGLGFQSNQVNQDGDSPAMRQGVWWLKGGRALGTVAQLEECQNTKYLWYCNVLCKSPHLPQPYLAARVTQRKGLCVILVVRCGFGGKGEGPFTWAHCGTKNT